MFDFLANLTPGDWFKVGGIVAVVWFAVWLRSIGLGNSPPRRRYRRH